MLGKRGPKTKPKPLQPTLNQVVYKLSRAKSRSTVSNEAESPRKKISQIFQSLNFEELANCSFGQTLLRQSARVCGFQQQPSFFRPILVKFLKSAVGPKLPLGRLYQPQNQAELASQSASELIKQWVHLFFSQGPREEGFSPEDSFEDEVLNKDLIDAKLKHGWNMHKMLVLVGPASSGKATAVRAVMASLGMKCYELNHTVDPLQHFRQTRENTHSETVHRNRVASIFVNQTRSSVASERFQRKIQLLRNFDQSLELARDKKLLVGEIKKYVKESKIPFVCTISGELRPRQLWEFDFDLLRLEPPALDSLAAYMLLVHSLELNFYRYRAAVRRLYDRQELTTARLAQELDRLDSGSSAESFDLMKDLIVELRFDLARILSLIENFGKDGLRACYQYALLQQARTIIADNKALPLPRLARRTCQFTQEDCEEYVRQYCVSCDLVFSNLLFPSEEKQEFGQLVERELLEVGKLLALTKSREIASRKKEVARGLGLRVETDSGQNCMQQLIVYPGRYFESKELVNLLLDKEVAESKYNTRFARARGQTSRDKYLSSDQSKILAL